MVSEALLVTSARMQMDNATVGRTGLRTFRQDVVLFPQELGRFVERHGVLGRYHLDNCANSRRSPGDGGLSVEPSVCKITTSIDISVRRIARVI